MAVKSDTNTNLSNQFTFFETGYILINDERYDVEEISINASRDMTPYHVAAQKDPIAQRPGKNKIEFSFKRAFSNAILSNMYDTCCVFDLILVNCDAASDQQLLLLKDCRLTQDNIGPINGSDVVSQDIQGVATKRVWKMCDIQSALDARCERKCPEGTSMLSEWTTQTGYNIATDIVSTVDPIRGYKDIVN